MTDSQMDAPELLPCPFCGERAEIWRAHEGRTAWIACMGKCSVLVSKEYKTDAEAIAAWNRRATPSVLAADPAVKALIADAEARVMRIAAGLFPGGYDANFAKIEAAIRETKHD